VQAGQEFASQFLGDPFDGRWDARRYKPLAKFGHNVVMVESAESFGKYTLLEKVAVGGMAEIYRAKTQGIGGFEKLLAIKRLHPQFGQEHDVAKMLVDEARIAVHLTHPNIAQIFDLGCIDDQYFIAMEFIDGVDLHQVNKRAREKGGEIPVPALVFAMAEALAGLHYAHTRSDADGKPLQIVHRDVSPQNIMVSLEGEVKIVDFGIAKAESRAQDDTQHGIIKGKFYYMSPEQAHGHHIDARTDIFAAGMVLYELLAGKNPYTRVEEYELLKAVRMADFPPLSSVRPDIDPELEEIVSRATQRDANYRYDDARAMQIDLMAYLDRHCGPYRRMELAKYVRGVSDRYDIDGFSDAEDSAVMSRDDFAASEASMIFEAGSVLPEDTDPLEAGRSEPNTSEPNPFDEEEPTQLWTPDAPEPSTTSKEVDRRDALSPPGLSGPAGLDASGSVPVPGSSTQESRTSLLDRLVPAEIERTHLIFGAVAVLVIGLGGVLTYLLMSGAKPETDSEQGESMAVERVDAGNEPTQPVAATVDVRIISTPPGAEVHVDGVSRGHTPTVLEALSTREAYELMLSLPGERTLERTIQPSRETEQLEFELPSAGAVLKVATYPTNAQITVDGEPAGRSPIDVPGLARSQPHEVVATLDDGSEVSRTVSWQSDDGRVKQIELQFGENGQDSDEEASADEQAPAPRRAKRPRSRPRKRRQATSSSKSSEDLDIWGDDDSEKSRTRSSKGSKSLDIWGEGDDSPTKGHISVKIEGEGKVYVDNKLVADNTSSYRHSLSAGTYNVRVYFSRIKRSSQTKRIRVRDGKTTSVSFAP
jgi:serine/threonine-protein kinase